MIDGLHTRSMIALASLCLCVVIGLVLALAIAIISLAGNRPATWLWVALGAAAIGVMVSWWGTLARGPP